MSDTSVTNPAAPGIQTTEYKLTRISLIVGAALEAFAGILHTLQDAGLSAPWFTTALLVVGAAVQIASLFGYTKSRTLLKAELVRGTLMNSIGGVEAAIHSATAGDASGDK